MAVTDSFKSAVAEGKVMDLRIMMKNSLLVDLSFSDFNEMEKLSRSVAGLYDEHDQREFKRDRSDWNDDYMNDLMVQVVGNFSHQRIDHLKEVVRYLRPFASQPQRNASANRAETRREQPGRAVNSGRPLSYQEQKRLDQRDGKVVRGGSAKITAGAVIGGVVCGAVTKIAGGAVLAGAAAGLVIGGAVAAVIKGRTAR